ncbi:MAG: hypothetical protein WKF40_05055 [Thermoleophilaceae bacterium]
MDCQPGVSGEKIADKGTIPLERNTSTIPADLVNNILRTPYRERLRLIIAELGTGLAGRPEDLQEVLKRAHPGLRETSKTLQILGDQNKVIEDFIRRLGRGGHAARAAQAGPHALHRPGGRDGRGHRRPPRAACARPSTSCRASSTSSSPPWSASGSSRTRRCRSCATPAPPPRASPSSSTRLGPFAEASRPAIRSLGKTSVVGRRAFEEGSNEVEELRRLARDVPGMAKPLRQFLESLDDDRRAIDADPARARGRTAGRRRLEPQRRQGRLHRLGVLLELLLLAGHVDQRLRRRRPPPPPRASRSNECTPYQNNTPMNPDNTPAENAALRKEIEKCNQFLGPNQPGINSPDFTVGAGAVGARRPGGQARAHGGRAQGAGPARRRSRRRPARHLQAPDHPSARRAGAPEPRAQAPREPAEQGRTTCSTAPRRSPRTARRPTAASSSTTSSRHEPPPGNSLARSQPGARRRGHGARVDHRRVHRLQRQRRPALRAHV